MGNCLGGSRPAADPAVDSRTIPSSSSPSPQPSHLFPDPLPNLYLSPDQLRYCSIALSHLKEKRRVRENTTQITKEFEHLQANRIKKVDIIRSCRVALDYANKEKNRYSDVLPFDQNRVVLNSSEDCRSSKSDYINASLITTSSTESVSKLIATQGPLPHTVEDFWEMVIQQHCPVIVMLTRLVDNNKRVRCADYFQAEDGRREFGNISIVTKWIHGDTSLVLRQLEVKYIRSEELPWSVLHIQYPEWPDQGVPQDTLAVREILKRIYHVPPNLGPIVVHCSAGIGRTGAFCIILNTIQRILVGKKSALDLVNTITIFRSQRAGMVQAWEQLRFCYEVIIDELEDLIRKSSD